MRSRGDGGRSASVAGYLQTVGARSEKDIPYLEAPTEEDDYLLEFYGMGRNQRPENYDTAPVLYEVTDMIFFTEAEPEDQKCYLTDQSGAVSFMEFPEEENAVWANVYEFGEDEQITEVSFVTWTKSGTYQVYYAPLSEDAPDADMSSWILLSEGELEHAGYMTVPSEWEEAVPEGKGAIILSITGESPSIGTEEPLYRDGNRTLYNPIYDRGSAFMLKDGNFVTAEIERVISEDYSHMEKPDISLQACTKAISGD